MRVALALIGLIAVAAPAADEPPALADLLVHVGRYVRGFQVDFATVIGDETYRQLVHLHGGGAVNEEISCSATYSNYRRFETSARIVPPR